ncbi:MAG: hypothetical protein JWQ30_1728 [Sediminibacterium sp.]|nr:hypothetical protein [Sediminibacterium sp.]
MRKAILSCIALLFSFCSFSQQNSVGAYTSFFNSGSHFSFGVIGGGSITTDKTFLIGIEYTRSLDKLFSIGGGIKYSYHNITTDNASTTGMSNPRHGHIQFVTLPLYLRADVWKYVFFTFGTFLDIQAESDLVTTMQGFGVTGGTGFKYDFKNKTTIFVHPFYEYHPTQNYIMFGLRTGVAYRF